MPFGGFNLYPKGLIKVLFSNHTFLLCTVFSIFFISSDTVHRLYIEIVGPFLSALSFKGTFLHAACTESISQNEVPEGHLPYTSGEPIILGV